MKKTQQHTPEEVKKYTEAMVKFMKDTTEETDAKQQEVVNMKELDTLSNVVQTAVKKALEPVQAIRSQLEAGLKKQQDIRDQFTHKYYNLVTRLSKGENVETKLNKLANDFAAAERLTEDHRKALVLNARHGGEYQPVTAQLKTVLTGANNCIELKLANEAELETEMHALGLQSKKLLSLLDTPKIREALSELVKAIVNLEIAAPVAFDFDVNDYIPSTNNAKHGEGKTAV